jgi:glycosyltransferase involved in cell wall biosynthesis
MNRKALLVIAPEPPPFTGMEVTTQALLEELRAAGIQVERVDTADPEDVLGNRGVWTGHNIVMALRHIALAARKSFQKDVGAVYLPIAQAFPALFRDIAFLAIARAARLPAIVHLHGGAFGGYYASLGFARRSLLKSSVGRAAAGIVLTEQLRPALECVLTQGRISVVPNGVDLRLCDPQLSKTKDEVHVLFLSSLYRWKGAFVFIEAFARAHAKRPQLRGTVAGDWPSEELRLEGEHLLQELGLGDKLAFPGVVKGESKAQAFREADIFCFAALEPEGQPLVILEAMAAGLPVVSPAWPGIADTVIEGETGLLVAEASPDSLAEQIVHLVDRPEERARMGTAGRTRYEAHYTQRAFGQRMIEVLRPFLDEGADEPALVADKPGAIR